MFTDTLDALAVLEHRARQLHAEAAAERSQGPSRTLRALAASLRRAADRLAAAAVAARPAWTR